MTRMNTYSGHAKNGAMVFAGHLNSVTSSSNIHGALMVNVSLLRLTVLRVQIEYAVVVMVAQ